MQQYGFKAIIAPSFADIFFNNCYKNGLLPIVLTAAQVDKIFHIVAANVGFEVTIDLPEQLVRVGDEAFPFEISTHRKYCLTNGFDDIGLTLRHAEEIKAFEAQHLLKFPWLSKTAI